MKKKNILSTASKVGSWLWGGTETEIHWGRASQLENYMSSS